MKRLFLSIITVFTCLSLLAQVPESFNYQVVVRDGSTNDPLVNQNISFRISILKGSSSGESQYSELHTSNTGDLGIVNLIIGNGTDKTGNITTIDWGADTYYLKIEIDKTGGSSYVEMGTTQLLSVPYALYAKSVSSYPETDPNAVLLTGDQTVAGNKTFTGTTTVPSPVNSTDAATKAYVDNLIEQLVSKGIVVVDKDVNYYSTVNIGSQVWMVENLKTTRYYDSEPIPFVTNNVSWSNMSSPGYCWYNNDESSYKTTYGALYNWYAINTGKLCPSGWHIPTDAEWTTLENYLIANGYNYDGTTAENKIGKSIASDNGWDDSSITGAVGNTDYPAKRNQTGFTALPGGRRTNSGVFSNIGMSGYWWSATEDGATKARLRILAFDDIRLINPATSSKVYGYSVRCIKD